jgi:single-strand DNA-binding protein
MAMFIVHLAGHLGKDPETRFTPSGQKVTTFTMAINLRKGKEDVTIWVRVTIWGDRFDKILSYLKKGSGVIVTGRMNPPSSYTDKEGRTQVSLEVTAEMIEFSPFGRMDRQGEGQYQQAAGSSQAGHVAYEYQAAQYDGGQIQMNHAPQYSKSVNYQTPASGQGSHHSQTVDEDTLPF